MGSKKDHSTTGQIGEGTIVAKRSQVVEKSQEKLNTLQKIQSDYKRVTNFPLVVDLDGTLTPTDTLVESLLKVIKQSPRNMFRIPFWLLQGRSKFKEIIAEHANFEAELLPYREPLIDYLRSEKAKGRQIVLATAAHHSIAEKVAMHLGLFDQCLSTKENINLKGKSKLQVIREKVGDAFVYAGDSKVDLPIWKASKAAVLVDVSHSMAKKVRQYVPIEREFQGYGKSLSVWLAALRVHQWLKNLLLFVPLMTAFSFTETSKLSAMFVAFLSFSFAASATYVVNDLLDLDNDRIHPRKRYRPFARALLPILNGLFMAAILLLIAIALALVVSINFLLMLLFYLILTSSYSWILKEYVMMDVLLLSLLYTLRILAGSVAVGITISSWLLVFSAFLFFGLALIKRCAELVYLEQSGLKATRGRDYLVTDLRVLWPLGVGASLSSVLVFGLFINAPETIARYNTPECLWLVAIGLIYWLARLWVKTSRGEMHDDPVVYAIKDRNSCVTIFTMVVVMLMAHYLTLGASL